MRQLADLPAEHPAPGTTPARSEPDMRQFTPEMLYADTMTRKHSYGDLSQAYAMAGNAYGAVMSAWLADINTVQAVMWERVMIATPDPEAAFVVIGSTITRTLAAQPTIGQGASTARDCIEHARAAMAHGFAESTLRAVEADYLPLDHLTHLPAPTAEQVTKTRASRLGGMDVAAVSTRRRSDARDLMRVAVAMADEGMTTEAMQQAWQADWATLESYLLDSAALCGDDTLVSVDFRWAIASAAVSQIPGLPANFVEAVTTIREAMAKALGMIEGSRLVERFEPLSPATSTAGATFDAVAPTF